MDTLNPLIAPKPESTMDAFASLVEELVRDRRPCSLDIHYRFDLVYEGTVIPSDREQCSMLVHLRHGGRTDYTYWLRATEKTPHVERLVEEWFTALPGKAR